MDYHAYPAISHSLLTKVEKGTAEEKKEETLPMLKGTVFHYMMETDDTQLIDSMVDIDFLISKRSKRFPILIDHLQGKTVEEAYLKHYNNDGTKAYEADLRNKPIDSKLVAKVNKVANDIADTEKIIDKVISLSDNGLDRYGDNPDLWFQGKAICEEALLNYNAIHNNEYWKELIADSEQWSELPLTETIEFEGKLVNVKGRLDKVIKKRNPIGDNKKLTLIDYKTIGKGVSGAEYSAVSNRNVRQLSWYVRLLMSSSWFKEHGKDVDEINAMIVFVNKGEVRFLPLSPKVLKAARIDQYVKMSPFHMYDANNQYQPFLSKEQLGFLRTHFWETDNEHYLVKGWEGLLKETIELYPEFVKSKKEEDYVF